MLIPPSIPPSPPFFPDVDVRRHPKAMAKIRAQAKKVKEVLSANTNIPVHVEGQGGREGGRRGVCL